MSFKYRFNQILAVQNEDAVTKVSLKKLVSFSNDGNSLIRSMVADTLIHFHAYKIDELLYHLAKDSNSMVRASACDSLSASNSKTTINFLKKKMANDKSHVVRAYAVLALGDVCKKEYGSSSRDKDLLAFLERNLEREKQTGTKISYYKVLYMLGEKQYLNDLIKEFDNPHYLNRCAAVYSLIDIVDDYHIKDIEKKVANRLKKEPFKSVLSLLETLTS